MSEPSIETANADVVVAPQTDPSAAPTAPDVAAASAAVGTRRAGSVGCSPS